MSFVNFSSAEIKKIATFLEKKEALVGKVEQIDKQLEAIWGGESIAKSRGVPKKTSQKRKSAEKRTSVRRVVKSTQKTSKRSLETEIINSLNKVGPQGVSAQDIADKLGKTVGNIRVWLYTTGKKNKQIKKVGKGRFRLA
jgi:multidrug efflux pump subunit AcrB